MKKVLGLDLGVTSIGWALIDEEEKQIIGLGSRIIPLTVDDRDEFTKGNAISKNQKRTQRRTQRKGYDRYQLRRKNLIHVLQGCNMLPNLDVMKLNKLDLWRIRSCAVTEKVSLHELGRILLHLNQKRGYKSARSEANLEKKETEYVERVNSRFELLKESGLTIGQKFFDELKSDQFYRIKDQVFPRQAYIDEYDSIMRNQQKYYPAVLTDELAAKIRDEIIYYQRKLKSQKSLVSICEFEGFWSKWKPNGKEKEIFVGPRVAPKSSPIFQICKIWETINNISLKRKFGDTISIPIEKKHELFEFMNNNEKLSYAQLLKILGYKKEDVYGNKQLINGLQGNKTKVEIMNCFENIDVCKHLFRLEISIDEFEDEVYLVDKKSGEILNTKVKKVVSSNVETQPLYKLWHTIYSINDKEECRDALIKNFSLPTEIAEKLSGIDFTKHGFGNKSHRAIRKILPYLIEGDGYSDACSYAGYNHSFSLTKQENEERKILEKLKPLAKNSLRQPIVEKILNQMINVVNAIIDTYGKPDEIRIELARELKQSKDERNDTFKAMNERAKENKQIEKELTEFGLRANRKNIVKWRLYHEISNGDNKQNAICIYCGKLISLSSAILGEEVDVEHIIPSSKLFDDSQSNKTLSHRKCNSNKGDRTAYDFMRSKSEEDFNVYIERVNTLFKNKIIGKTKRDKLLMASDKIPRDFIDRQLRETQYISKKAREVLLSICHNVWATSGSVTSELRHIWGWDDVLINLQLPKYRSLGLIEEIEINENGSSRKKEIIKGWTKRDDHRHHAVDALTIACTKQGFIQRLNTLNSSTTRNEMMREIEHAQIDFDHNKNIIENYIYSQKPFSTKYVENEVNKILISFKAGKKVATLGKRKIKRNRRKVVVQTNIIVPRGALSEESIYGKIKTIVTGKSLKYLFENPDLIFKPYIRSLVEDRLAKYENNVKKALASVKKDPIYLDKENKTALQFATCYKEEVVIKKPVHLLNEKQVEDIVDPVIRAKVMERLEKYGGKARDAFKDLENNPIYYDDIKKISIKNVRCLTGLSAIEPIKKDVDGNDIGFVKPGNNHHLAIYIDESGKKQIHICTFWHAVERKKYGLPVIIKNPSDAIEKLVNDENYENIPSDFLEKLPDNKWVLSETFQQNEMFVFDISREKFVEHTRLNQLHLISNRLYRVQKISSTGYYVVFRHHLATTIDNELEMRGFSSFENFNALKVRIDSIGNIIEND